MNTTKIQDYESAYNDIFFLLPEPAQRKHKEIVDEYFICREIGAQSFEDFLTQTAENYVASCSISEEHKVVKNGKDKSGRQRYFCQDCGKTFYATQDSLVSNVKQNISVWIRFVRGMLRQKTLQELSEDCGISKSTALSWRLRVFRTLELLAKNVTLEGVVVADDTRLSYNLKGNRGNDFIMPRKSRARGGANTIHNYQQNSVCVLCAIDENGNSFSKVVGFGTPSASRICEGFKGKISANASPNVLVTDGAPYLKKTIETYKFSKWEKLTTLKKGNRKTPDTTGEHNIQRINNYHSRLKRFFRNYNGVSSRYLPGYLLLFDYLQNNKNTSEDRMCQEILSTLVNSSTMTTEQLERRYIIPVSNVSGEETWEKRVPLKEQKIYLDWVNGGTIKQITQKYKINKRKIYTIKDKVCKYKLHNAIINKNFNDKPPKESKPIKQRDWEIFIKRYHYGATVEEVAIEYDISPKRVYAIVEKVLARPESQGVEKFAKPTKPKCVRITRAELADRDKTMYVEYKILRSIGLTRRQIYERLAEKYGLVTHRIRKIILKNREKDDNYDFVYKFDERRRFWQPQKFYEHMQARNVKIVNEIINLKEKHGLSNETIFRMVAQNYEISHHHIHTIFYNQSKYLNILNIYLERKGLKPPEEAPERAGD